MLSPEIEKPASAQGNTPIVITAEEAEAAMLRYADATRMCERLQLEFETEFNHLSDRYHVEFDQHERAAKTNKDAILAYAQGLLDEENSKRNRPKRSLMLPGGIVRFSRESSRVVYSVAIEQVIKNLRRFRLGHLVETKHVVSVPALRKLDPELHGKIGFSLHPAPLVGSIELSDPTLGNSTPRT
jgi:phage host-nuclease inhibitor protein Gam